MYSWRAFIWCIEHSCTVLFVVVELFVRKWKKERTKKERRKMNKIKIFMFVFVWAHNTDVFWDS